MIRSCLVVGIVILMCACAHGPVSSQSAPEVPDKRVFNTELTTPGPDRTEVILTRDKLELGIACSIRIWVDNSEVADIRVGERIRLFVAPGTHAIRVHRRGFYCKHSQNTAEAQFDAVQGSTVVLRITSGWAVGQNSLIAIVPSSLDVPGIPAPPLTPTNQDFGQDL